MNHRACSISLAAAVALVSQHGAHAGSQRHDAPQLRSAQQAAARDGFANVRTLSFDSETIRVTPPAAPNGTAVGAVVASAPAPSGEPSAPPAAQMTTTHVRGVVHAHVNELATCAAAGATNGRVHGNVTMRLVIDPRGHVRDAAVPQSTMIWSVPRCLTDAARAWRFDPPPGGVTVVIVYPIVFTQ